MNATGGDQYATRADRAGAQAVFKIIGGEKKTRVGQTDTRHHLAMHEYAEEGQEGDLGLRR